MYLLLFRDRERSSFWKCPFESEVTWTFISIFPCHSSNKPRVSSKQLLLHFHFLFCPFFDLSFWFRSLSRLYHPAQLCFWYFCQKLVKTADPWGVIFPFWVPCWCWFGWHSSSECFSCWPLTNQSCAVNQEYHEFFSFWKVLYHSDPLNKKLFLRGELIQFRLASFYVESFILIFIKQFQGNQQREQAHRFTFCFYLNWAKYPQWLSSLDFSLLPFRPWSSGFFNLSHQFLHCSCRR
jgi:hypothetical protein